MAQMLQSLNLKKKRKNASKMVKNLLKVIHVLEGLQQAEHLKIVNMYGLQSTKISDSARTRR